MIAIRFKHPPQQLFHDTRLERINPNWIAAEHPARRDACTWKSRSRRRGWSMHTRMVRMNAGYRADGEHADRRL